MIRIPELKKDDPNYRFVAGESITRGINLCLMCAHYRKEHKCDAFPEGIPHEIWILKVFHNKPYPGDNGINYKPLPEYDTSIENIKATYDKYFT